MKPSLLVSIISKPEWKSASTRPSSALIRPSPSASSWRQRSFDSIGTGSTSGGGTSGSGGVLIGSSSCSAVGTRGSTGAGSGCTGGGRPGSPQGRSSDTVSVIVSCAAWSATGGLSSCRRGSSWALAASGSSRAATVAAKRVLVFMPVSSVFGPARRFDPRAWRSGERAAPPGIPAQRRAAASGCGACGGNASSCCCRSNRTSASPGSHSRASLPRKRRWKAASAASGSRRS